ncbi:class I SAM-dependent methyltransferase [Adlercreutzia sp. ZJ138]|uniref:Eco57I restriction-modification methylase domain-containing protein n=1 Tax=Adlercreutzia sp. ZJ138 TaxID=2709405 RepID=UPI0013ED1012|nr:class I SAM-dependent methyltransferase [Adlercreutzia sp. ZJ138]
MRLKEHNTDKKLRGAYYTPKSLAEVMVGLSGVSDAKAILEPSCGDGVFIEALGECIDLRNDALVDAIEIDEEALLKAQSIQCGEATVNYQHRDFFEFYEEAKPGSYDLIVGNPPYIRYQYLEPEQRTLLADILNRQGMRANKLVNAWVGFMVACTDLLAEGGTLSFVIPADILQVVYAEDLRRFLARHYSNITLLAFTKLVFSDIEQEIVVFIGKKGADQSSIRVIEADRVEDLMGRSFDEVEFQPFVSFDEKWTRYFINACDAKVLNSLYKDERLVSFSDIAIINVGVTTGNNSFFSLTDETSAAYELDDFTLPLIGRSSHASGVFFTNDDWERNRSQGKRARLLVLEDGQYAKMTKVQRAYIDEGEERGEDKGYKCSIRGYWYAVPSIWIPDAFFLRRNNLYPKFVLNRCNAISTDTMHRMKFEGGVDPELAVIAYYNSIAFAFTELCGRSYGGGVLEILPKEVGNIRVLDPAQLAIDDALKSDVIERVDDVIRTGENIETALDYVDRAVLVDHMGFDEEVCKGCRRIWQTLQARRLGRSTR